MTSARAWPPRRQRVVVRVVPAVNGAWIDAIVETQSIADAHAPAGPGRIELAGGWPTATSTGDRTNITTTLAARMATAPGGVAEPIYSLPALESEMGHGPAEPPWAHSRYPRLSRAGHKVLEDYRNFYSCESLTCITAAFGAGARSLAGPFRGRLTFGGEAPLALPAALEFAVSAFHGTLTLFDGDRVYAALAKDYATTEVALRAYAEPADELD